MENFIKCDLEFDDDQLNYYIDWLNTCFNNNRKNFCSLCLGVYKIWDYCKNNFWVTKKHEVYNSYKLLAKFGFDKKAVSRYKSCYERFMYPPDIQGYPCTLVEYLQDFSPSKLFELLPLSQETVFELVDKQFIRPEMTVKQIREYIKTMKDGDKPEKVIEDTSSTEINEEEIPMAYDPKQEYEYSYFESKTKNQLLNIVWELQKAYQKLKNKKEK